MTTTLPDLKRIGREVAAAETAYHAACKTTDEAQRAEEREKQRWAKAKQALADGVAAYGVAAGVDPTVPQAPRDVRVSWWWMTRLGSRQQATGNSKEAAAACCLSPVASPDGGAVR